MYCIWSYPKDGGITLLRNVSAYILTSFHGVIFLTKCLHQYSSKLIATVLIIMIMKPSCPENVRAWPGHRCVQNRHITGVFCNKFSLYICNPVLQRVLKVK